MGLCESCCPRGSGESGQEDAYGDRSRLVTNEYGNNMPDSSDPNDHDTNGGVFDDEGRFGSLSNGGEFPFGNSKGASVPKIPIDENQVALNEVLTKMAQEVIDIGVAEAAMEPSDYEDRAKEYGRKLNTVAHNLANKYDELKASDGLIGSSKVAENSGRSEVLDESEAVLISEISARAQDSSNNMEFQIQNAFDLVVNFGDNCHLNGDSQQPQLALNSSLNSSNANKDGDDKDMDNE